MKGFPSRYIVLDTETISVQSSEDSTVKELTLRLGVVKLHDPDSGTTSSGVYFNFTDTATLHAWLELLPCNSTPILIFAHNMGFDARICEFFRYLAAGHYTLDPPDCTYRKGCYRESLAVIDNSPFIVRLFRDDGQVFILCDTVQWFACSLKELGESVGVAKMEMPSEDALDQSWLAYCCQDVEVLDTALQRLWGWLRFIRCEDWQYTRASQAMYLWRTRYGKSPIVHPQDTTVVALDRHAYYGGRSECFRLGRIDETCWKLDVNSMYPFIMRNNVYPYKVHSHDHEPGAKTDHELQYPLAHTAEVWLESETVPYPVRCSDGVYWVTGQVRTILCGPELEQAYARGHVRSIGRWTRYETTNLFRRWVDEFHGYRLAARKAGIAVHDMLCKLMLNSLYGKFGQRTGNWVPTGIVWDRSRFASGKVVGVTIDKDVEFRVLAGVEEVRIRDDEDSRSFVPISAYVASYGRVHMDAIRAGLDPSGVYYQCVDSLIVRDDQVKWFADQHMLDDDRLGAWKLEGPYEWINIRGVNNLDIPGREIRAGLKAGAIPLGRDWWEVEEWESAPAGIYRGNVSSVSIQRIAKSLSSRYVRGDISSDGSVRPYRVSNWDVSPEMQARQPLPRSES